MPRSARKIVGARRVGQWSRGEDALGAGGGRRQRGGASFGGPLCPPRRARAPRPRRQVLGGRPWARPSASGAWSRWRRPSARRSGASSCRRRSGGVTDRLLEAVEAAVARTGAHRTILREVRERHAAALVALAPEPEREALGRALDALFTELGELLYGVYLLRECTPRFRDAIVSAGERAAVPLVAAAFRRAGHAAVALDAVSFVPHRRRLWRGRRRLRETTGRLVRAALAEVPDEAVAVVTGFVASTEDGVTTTLGRSRERLHRHDPGRRAGAPPSASSGRTWTACSRPTRASSPRRSRWRA